MHESADPRELAAAKRRAREQRIRDLRMRIAAAAAALFVAAWGGLYVQLVSGHDPALAGTVTPVSQSADPESTTDDDSWSDDGSTASTSDSTLSDDTTATDATQTATSQPADVTTRQS